MIVGLAGLYVRAFPPNGSDMVSFYLLVSSGALIVIGFLVGIFTSPYYMSVEDGKIANLGEQVRKQNEGIRNVLAQLKEIGNQINTYKGTPDSPYPNAYAPLNSVQDQIQRPIMNQLKSLLPDGDKDA